jgi:hypothetical protein
MVEQIPLAPFATPAPITALDAVNVTILYMPPPMNAAKPLFIFCPPPEIVAELPLAVFENPPLTVV